MQSRIEQIIQSLKDQGLEEKYGKPGVYSISIEGKLVYIGKSVNMLQRIANHIYHIENPGKTNKYIVLSKAKQNQYQIQFDVVYCSQEKNEKEIENDIGYQEGWFIRQYRPALNYQIPKADDWHHWTVNRRAKWVTLEEIMGKSVSEFIF